jgi:hypothetical protein
VSSPVCFSLFQNLLPILPWWHTPLAVKLPDWLGNTNPFPGSAIISDCLATSYITFTAIGIGHANAHGRCSP